MIFFDEFLVDPRVFAIHALHIAQRSQFDQVLIPRLVLRQQYLVKAFILLILGEYLPVPVAHDIEFTADDRLDLQGAVLILVFIDLRDKGKGAEHIAVIGDCQRGHAVFHRFLIKALDRRGSVQQRKLGMGM